MRGFLSGYLAWSSNGSSPEDRGALGSRAGDVYGLQGFLHLGQKHLLSMPRHRERVYVRRIPLQQQFAFARDVAHAFRRSFRLSRAVCAPRSEALRCFPDCPVLPRLS